LIDNNPVLLNALLLAQCGYFLIESHINFLDITIKYQYYYNIEINSTCQPR